MAELPVSTAPVALKPAWKTTEGWLAFLSATLGAATSTGLIADGSIAARIAGLTLVAVSTAMHSWGRATVKAAQ